jgi:methionyl-tRNA synthetase
MPDTSKIILQKFGYDLNHLSPKNFRKGVLEYGIKIDKGSPVFERIDTKTWKRIIKTTETEEAEKVMSEENTNIQNIIEIDDFKKVDLRVAQVIKAENIEKSNKLLRLQLDVGPLGIRQIIAGIKNFYSPEDLENKKIIIISNLKPAKLMGETSEGMLLAAKDSNGNLSVLTVEKDVEAGAKIS